LAESFDAFRYMSYLRSQARWIVASGAIAVAVALGVSLLMTREYTATARLLIDPPAGADPRAAVAISPIYLESLKTYEQMASGDSQFRKAIEQLGLHALVGARPIESVKKRVLRVGIVRNTRVLEISATLPDPRKAQALAGFLAQSTVEANRSVAAAGSEELIGGIEKQQREIRQQLQETEAAWVRAGSQEPVGELQAALDNDGELRATLRQEAAGLQMEIAAGEQRAQQVTGSEAEQVRKDNAIARTRYQENLRQLQELERQDGERAKLLAARTAHREQLEADRKAGLAALGAIDARLREARSDAGYRGERLNIIDPGIVPERPSSPDLPLNVAAALLIGLLLPILYFTLEMSFQEQRASGRRSVFQVAAKARDE